MDFKEGLEHVFALLFRNAAARIRNVELNLVLAAFLELNGNLALGRGVFGSVLQQVCQYVADVRTINECAHLRCIHHELHLFLLRTTNLTDQFLTELVYLYLFHLQILVSVLQFTQCLHMLREVEQCLYFGLTAIEFFQCRLQLCRHVADELGLQCVAVVGQFDDLLLFTRLHDEAHEYNGT